MNFFELIANRYSVREYTSQPVELEKIQKVMAAAQLAPTASNRQPFKIIVINTVDKQSELLSICQNEWFVQAPIILCICGIPSVAWVRRDGKQYMGIDIGIVADHIVLAATELGLGTCIMAAFDEVNARKALLIPDNVEPLLFIPLGYPAVLPAVKIRKNLDELVSYDHW